MFYKVLVFEIKKKQRVRLWNENFTTRQIFVRKFYNASDFGLEKIRHVRIQNKDFSTSQN